MTNIKALFILIFSLVALFLTPLNHASMSSHSQNLASSSKSTNVAICALRKTSVSENPCLVWLVVSQESASDVGVNWYSYTSGNPIMFTDPTGYAQMGAFDVPEYGPGPRGGHNLITYASMNKGSNKYSRTDFIEGARTGLEVAVGMTPFVGDASEWGEATFGYTVALRKLSNTDRSVSLACGTIGGVAALYRAGKSALDIASSSKQASNLKDYLRQTQKYGQANVKELQNGRIRFYGDITPASKSGTMSGRRVVREWDPKTGNTRTWMETVDHSNKVRIVRPETGGPKVHYQFNENDDYTGKF